MLNMSPLRYTRPVIRFFSTNLATQATETIQMSLLFMMHQKLFAGKNCLHAFKPILIASTRMAKEITFQQ